MVSPTYSAEQIERICNGYAQAINKHYADIRLAETLLNDSRKHGHLTDAEDYLMDEALGLLIKDRNESIRILAEVQADLRRRASDEPTQAQ